MPDKKESTVKRGTCFRSAQFSALSVHVDGEFKARFVAFFEKFQGDTVKVGYLETSDEAVLKVLSDDPNVEEITTSEFDKATGEKSVQAPLPAV